MKRREFLMYSAAAAATVAGVGSAHAQDGPIKIGVVGPKTGGMASGAAVTHWPNFQLWANDVNTAAACVCFPVFAMFCARRSSERGKQKAVI